MRREPPRPLGRSASNTTIRAAVNVFFALSSFVVELSGMLTGATCTAAKLTSVAAVKSGGAEPNGIAKANTRAGELMAMPVWASVPVLTSYAPASRVAHGR